jgi:CRISPR-associated protein Cas2
MRLIVFFVLPTLTKTEKRAYVLFRRFLLNDGYDMIQWSVYGRLLNGHDDRDKHLKRLAENLPPAGAVRCMTVTEKQFAGIQLLVGRRSFQEKTISANQLLLF